MELKNESSLKIFIFTTKINDWNSILINELLTNKNLNVQGIFIGSSLAGHKGLKHKLKRLLDYGVLNMLRVLFQKIKHNRGSTTLMKTTLDLINSSTIKTYGDDQYTEALNYAVHHCDYTILVYFNRIIPKKFTKYKIVNTHSGKLPDYRGVQPVFWALLNDEKKIGVSAHFIDDGIDTGPILYQTDVQSNNNSIHDLMIKCSEALAKNLSSSLLKYHRKELSLIYQDKNVGNYYSRPSAKKISEFLMKKKRYF